MNPGYGSSSLGGSSYRSPGYGTNFGTSFGGGGQQFCGRAGGGGLRRILQDRLLTGNAVDNRLVQFLHGDEHKCVKQVPHLFPERTFVVSPLLPGGLKQRAAPLLRLVHEEDQ